VSPITPNFQAVEAAKALPIRKIGACVIPVRAIPAKPEDPNFRKVLLFITPSPLFERSPFRKDLVNAPDDKSPITHKQHQKLG
jgi:hypothetical protein